MELHETSRCKIRWYSNEQTRRTNVKRFSWGKYVVSILAKIAHGYFAHKLNSNCQCVLGMLVATLTRRCSGKTVRGFGYEFSFVSINHDIGTSFRSICIAKPSVTIAKCLLNNFGHEPANDYLQTYVVLIISKIIPGWLVRTIYLFAESIVMYVYIEHQPRMMSNTLVHWYRRRVLVNTTFIRSVLLFASKQSFV